jgi:hypothetical protein
MTVDRFSVRLRPGCKLTRCRRPSRHGCQLLVFVYSPGAEYPTGTRNGWPLEFKTCIGGDNRPTVQNRLLAENPDLAREFRGVLLFFSWVSYGLARSARHAITDSPVAAACWNSFEQSTAPPGASLGSTATPVAEIVTRATESFETANGYVNQARAKLPATNAIFYTPSERELIGRLWAVCIN